jgi:alkanesulfonate monooxygenase SsuD/methylene tetrahydromethanopterin reductase-like flavin-dependent oxidoreductase (luciferase family)
MPRIEFGLSLSSMTSVAPFARNAEAMGFDYLTCGEHLMFHGPIGNSLIALSAAATVTQKIKLMSTIVLVPLYGAAMLAKMTAVLDVVSGGRYHFGIGVGGEFPREFEAAGVPVKERGPRTNEALEVITRLWTEKRSPSAAGSATSPRSHSTRRPFRSPIRQSGSPDARIPQ